MNKTILIEEMVQKKWCTSLWHKIRYVLLKQEKFLNSDAVHVEYFCRKCREKRSGYIILVVDNVSKE